MHYTLNYQDVDTFNIKKLVSSPTQQRILGSSKPISQHRLCCRRRAVNNNLSIMADVVLHQ